MIWSTFRWSIIVSLLALAVAFVYGGWHALYLCVILAILEISLSFDNAIINATVLRRMSDFWQKIFLTIGIIIAVFGMRLLFPLVIVGAVAHISPVEAFQLALEQGDPETPGTYGYIITEAHPQIAAFGGMFLLMLFLNFIFTERKIKWLHWIEEPLAKVGRLDQAAVVVAMTLLVVAAEFLAKEPHVVMIAGILGLITYITINSLSALFERSMEEKLAATSKKGQIMRATGKAGFFLFLYLEVLDASFSFDGVIGAFAITTDPIIIALGLGLIGAIFVRSITIYLVKKGSLNEYVYLEHGAHWAIGALALILIISIGFHISELITGTIGLIFIGTALYSSIRKKRRG